MGNFKKLKSLVEELKSLVEDLDTKSGRYFNLFILFLIFIALISFSIGTLPNLSEDVGKVLLYLDIVIIIIFTIEYFLRIIVADKKLKYIFSFLGLIDLIAILPFYISTGLDLRAVRSIRFLRLFKIIVRYTKAIDRLRHAFKKRGMK
jgi:voltage-gated potassium channel